MTDTVESAATAITGGGDQNQLHRRPVGRNHSTATLEVFPATGVRVGSTPRPTPPTSTPRSRPPARASTPASGAVSHPPNAPTSSTAPPR